MGGLVLKKAFIALFVLYLIFMCSVCFASPPMSNLKNGESIVWYDYANRNISTPRYNYGSQNINGFEVDTAVSDHLILHVSHHVYETTSHIRGGNSSAYGVEYYLTPNMRLAVADNDPSRGGDAGEFSIRATTNIDKNLDAFISADRVKNTNNYDIGIIYQLLPNTLFEAKYIYSKDNPATYKGYSFGLGYKF